MSRLGTLSLFGLLVVVFVAASATPPEDAKFNNVLAVQAAMVRARAFLNEMQTQKAVDILEEQLPNVNNNPQYLSLLRDAYRSFIRDLHLAGRPELANRYLERLCILDPGAMKDASLLPIAAPAPKYEPEPEKKTAFPQFKVPGLKNPFVKQEEPKAVPAKATVRALPQDAFTEDPFDRKNQRETPLDTAKASQAREHLLRGVNEFKHGRYAQARNCFEQAYQTDPGSLEACREQWAYCIIDSVTVAMEQPGVLPAKLPELQKQIDGAIQMAPTKMLAVGKNLSQTLEQRAKLASATFRGVGGAEPAGAGIDGALKASHLGKNREGWDVTKTKHFLIFHKQNSDLAERVAATAEATRAAMYRKWFASEAVAWDPPCELILHPTAVHYTQMTGVPGHSPGHTKIESDPSGRVVARRMDLRLDLTDMVTAVLPHETTHVVLAGMFNANHVPRWADEGIAVLSEPNEKIELHRRKLLTHHKEGTLFGLKELMELADYPQPRRIGAFYAQSVVLVEFLTQQKSPKVFTDFVKDGLRQGYEASLQRHYGMTFAQLDELWQKQVINNNGGYAAQK